MPAPAIPLIATLMVKAAGYGVLAQLFAYTASSLLVSEIYEDMQPDEFTPPRGIEIQQNVCSSTVSLPLFYGQGRIGGNDVYIHLSGENNKYLWLIQTLAEGECDSIAQNAYLQDLVYINDIFLANNADLLTHVDYQFYAGTADQTYDTDLNAVNENWTDNMRRTCYIRWKFTYNPDLFPSIPKRNVILKGRKIWLPDNTQAYSNNAAAILYDFLRSPHCALGLGWPEENIMLTDEVDYYSYLAAYNYCEGDSDSQAWEFNGAIFHSEQARDVIDRIRKHFRGSLRWSDGMFYFKYKDLNDESVAMNLTDNHIARDENGKAMISISEPGDLNSAEGLLVSFINTTGNNYIEDYVRLGETENAVVRDVDFTGYSSREMAGAMGSYILERQRPPYDRVIAGVFRDDCQQLERDDLITLTCTALGYSAQYMRVIRTQRHESGLVTLELQLEHTDLYNDEFDVETETTYTCTLPEATNFDPVTSAERYVEPEFESDNTLTLEVSDLNRVYVIDSNDDLTVIMPSVGEDQLASKVKFKHYGTGKLTVQAADSDTIDNSSAGGYIYHQQSGISQEGSITLQLAQSTHWAIDNILGPWFTDAGDELFLHTALYINDKTFGNQGVQFEYNNGVPRGYVGDGANASWKFDGTKLTWKAINTELDASGNLTCTGGAIGGWTISSTTLANGTNIILDSSNKAISINSSTFGNDGCQIQYNAGNPRAYIGDGANQFFKFDGTNVSWKGTNTELTAAGELSCSNINATGGSIGGWTLAATTFSSSNIIIDSGNDRILCNTITIDGANDRIRSSNYVSGFAGAGFTVEPDLVEAGNLAARGILRMVVFQKDVNSALGGNFICSKGSDVLAEDLEDDSGEMVIEGNETFAVGDILQIKDGIDEEWFQVTDVSSDLTTYTVERDKDDAYGSSESSFAGLPAWKKGATVVNYGASGDGLIHMTASETNAPHLKVLTHAGAPWDALTERLRIGNLNGYLGYSSDTYGIGIGNTDSYIKCDPTNGIQIQVTAADAITVKEGADIKLEASASDPGIIKLVGTENTVIIGGFNDEGHEICIRPVSESVSPATTLSLGLITKRWERIYAISANFCYFASYYDSNNLSGITIDQDYSANTYWVALNTKYGGTVRTIYFVNVAGTCEFRPYILDDNTIDLGHPDCRWKNFYAVTATLSNTGLHLLDTNASHDLIIAPGSDLTADRTLTLTTGDADRTLTINGNTTLNDWFDQSVKTSASPTFAALTVTGAITSGGDALAKIKTGSYTGDGTTSKAVTGVGFNPKYIRIWEHQGDGSAMEVIETTNTMMARDAQGLDCVHVWSGAAYHYQYDNGILSLDSDGFTVSDNNANWNPNKDGIDYDYLCLGW